MSWGDLPRTLRATNTSPRSTLKSLRTWQCLTSGSPFPLHPPPLASYVIDLMCSPSVQNFKNSPRWFQDAAKSENQYWRASWKSYCIFFLYLQIVPNRHISFLQTPVKSHGLVPGWLGIAMITFSPEWLHFQLNGAVKIPSLKKNVLCCSLNLFHECKRVRDKQCQKLGRKKNVNAFKYVFPVPHEMVSQVLICCSWILEPLDWEKAYKSYFVCVCICVCVCVLSPSVEATLCDPMDGSPPGSSVHGISQVSILEPVAISYSMGSFWPRDWTRVSCVFCISRWIL